MFYSQRPTSIPCNKNLKRALSEFKLERSFSIVYIIFHFFDEITKKKNYYLFNTHFKNTIRFYLFVTILHQKWSLWRCLRYYSASLFTVYQFSSFPCFLHCQEDLCLSVLMGGLNQHENSKPNLTKKNTLFEEKR